LDEGDENGDVSRVLGDLLATTVFTGELGELWDDCGAELHHDRCRDVGHDAEGEDTAFFEPATREDVEEGADGGSCVGRAVIALHSPVEVILDDAGVYSGDGDGDAETDDEDHGKGEEQPVLELFNLPDVSKCGNHGEILCWGKGGQASMPACVLCGWVMMYYALSVREFTRWCNTKRRATDREYQPHFLIHLAQWG